MSLIHTHSEALPPSVRIFIRKVASPIAAAFLWCWIESARLLVIVGGLLLVGYVVLRPWLDSSPGAPFSDTWTVLQTWPALIGNTLVVCGVASTVCLLVGVPLAFLLFRTDIPGRRFFSTGLVWFACIPTFASASAVLSVVGLDGIRGHVFAAGLIHGWLGIPLAVLQLGLAYRTINGTWEEAAVLDSSRWVVYLRFDLPLIGWAILSVVVVQFWMAGTEIAVTDLLGIRTLGEEVYVAFQLTRSAALQSLVAAPFALIFCLLVWGTLHLARSVDLRFDQHQHHPPRRMRLDGWLRTLCMAMLIVWFVFMLAPLIRFATEIGSISHLARYARALRAELRDSSLIAAASCVWLTALVMGLGDMVVARSRWSRLLRLVLILLMALPTPCLAVALLEMTSRPGLLGQVRDSSLMLVIGQVIRWLPIAALIAAPGFVRMTQSHRDAARLDACTTPRLHWHLCWPLSSRYLALAGLCVAILVFGELSATVLLSAPGVLPVSVRFFTLVHYGLHGEAAAICVLVALVMTLPGCLLVDLVHRSE